jgi:hypothetical protein
MIDVACLQCGTVHHASPEHLGRQLRCAGCGAPVLIASPTKQDTCSGTLHAETPQAPRRETLKNRAAVFLQRLRHPLLTGALLLVVAALVIIFGIRLFGTKESQKAGSASNNQQGPAKSLSQEAAATQMVPTPSVASSVPAPQVCDERSARRLANGFMLDDEGQAGGLGIIKIVNGTTDDAVLNLVTSNSGETVRSVYIRNHNRASIRRLHPGTYRAYFALGTDWDDSSDSFVCESAFNEFGKPLVLRELTEIGRTEYTELEITLHPVISGNVVSAPISKAAFRSTMPHRQFQ